MEGIIINYRIGKRTQKANQMVITSEEIKNKEEAKKIIGTKAHWETPTGKTIGGKVTQTHGNNGAFLVKFNKGLPGQAVGTTIHIEE